ncbi:hypothetical protein BOX15_Mlig011996g3 [Macrostomum lignano]|uniref:PQ-loop repeat-containing protein 1 n=1 Tax=Macrostomum lignano TaxID=282301 RepID=A0A267DL82_9PLAT|nr:hypothetical protein BOX15_Mlig011996g3 [Macrostomum lignano]
MDAHFDATAVKQLGLQAVKYVSILLMVFGGVVPYVPQYLQIKRTGNTEGFSQYVCLTLLLANILRILFWFCKHFELPLLAQSFVMIFTMLCMVHIYVRTRQKTILPTDKIRRFIDLESAHFWKWTDFLSYLQFLLLFTVAASCITYPCPTSPFLSNCWDFWPYFSKPCWARRSSTGI